MNAENWREDETGWFKLLEAIKSGRITHIDESELRPLKATTRENVALLKDDLRN